MYGPPGTGKTLLARAMRAVGAEAEEGGGGGDSEVQRTVLELLNQLDGFEPAQHIKVIMAGGIDETPYVIAVVGVGSESTGP